MERHLVSLNKLNHFQMSAGTFILLPLSTTHRKMILHGMRISRRNGRIIWYVVSSRHFLYATLGCHFIGSAWCDRTGRTAVNVTSYLFEKIETNDLDNATY